MKIGEEISVIQKAGYRITPIPTKYNTGLQLKVEKNGKELKGSREKIYKPGEVWKVYDAIVQDLYDKCIKKETIKNK